MAITNAQFNASDYVRASGKRLITCGSDKIGTGGVFNYRFYLELVYNSNTYAFTFRPNNLDSGLINITKILQTIVSPINQQQVLTIPEEVEASGTVDFYKQNLHSIPHEKYDAGGNLPQYFSTGGTTAAKVVATLYDFYGDTATGTPSKRATGSATDNLYILSGYDIQSDKIAVDYTDYKLTSTSNLLLNNNYYDVGTEKIINVALSDWGTLAFLNTTKEVNTASLPYMAIVRYVNTSGSVSQQLLTNETVTGGEYDATGVDDGAMILYLASYPANLNKLPATFIRPSDVANLDYYTISITNSSAVALSKMYKFNIVDECEKYARQRFAFLNKFGVWEYITFNEKRTDNISTNNTTIKKSVLDYTANYDVATVTTAGYTELGYIPNVAHQNEKIVATNQSETFTVNTGYLSNSDTEKIKDMFISSQINYINTDGSARAVILTTKSVKDIKNIDKHYEQISYSLTFKYSVATYNNILA